MFKHHWIRRSLVGGVMIAAAGIPVGAAQARYIDEPGGSSGPVPAAPPAASQVARAQPIASSGSSFQWGDAGIGAAGATVMLGAGALGAGVTRRRRSERPLVG